MHWFMAEACNLTFFSDRVMCLDKGWPLIKIYIIELNVHLKNWIYKWSASYLWNFLKSNIYEFIMPWIADKNMLLFPYSICLNVFVAVAF